MLVMTDTKAGNLLRVKGGRIGAAGLALVLVLALVLAMLLGAAGSVGVSGPASAQVPTANPARTWIPSPRVTVGDLWREVRSGGMAVIASATSQDQQGLQTIMTVFQGGGQLFRCLEWVSIEDGIDRQALCTTVR